MNKLIAFFFIIIVTQGCEINNCSDRTYSSSINLSISEVDDTYNINPLKGVPIVFEVKGCETRGNIFNLKKKDTLFTNDVGILNTIVKNLTDDPCEGTKCLQTVDIKPLNPKPTLILWGIIKTHDIDFQKTYAYHYKLKSVLALKVKRDTSIISDRTVQVSQIGRSNYMRELWHTLKPTKNSIDTTLVCEMVKGQRIEIKIRNETFRILKDTFIEATQLDTLSHVITF